MIQNDQELRGTQERVLYFEKLLAHMRVNASVEEYPAMASGYLAEVKKMQQEIVDYLQRHASESVQAESG